MLKGKVNIYSESEIEGIRRACRASAFVRENLKKSILPNMSTEQVDSIAHGLIEITGGKSAFLGYNGFPCNICISINDEVVHGLGRDDKIIRDGDIVSIDVGVFLNGYFGDNAETFIVGSENSISENVKILIEKTRESLYKGIEMAVENNCIEDISRAVQNVADVAGLGVVRDYVGHGCGKNLHEPPEIPNYVTGKKTPVLKSGMVVAIEPMLSLGSHEVEICDDGWTVKTRDGSVSAHFEHTVLVNGNNPEILTCLATKM